MHSQTSLGKIAISILAGFLLISFEFAAANGHFPPPTYPGEENLLRRVGSVKTKLTVESGRVSKQEVLTFEFYESRRRGGKRTPQVRKLNHVYPEAFRESIARAVAAWEFPPVSFGFEVDFHFQLTDEPGPPNVQRVCYETTFQSVNRLSVPSKIVVTALRFGPDSHID